MSTRRYRHPRYHFPRLNRHEGTYCPDPDNCVHTTDFVNESCECCGQWIHPEKPAVQSPTPNPVVDE
jgi:hypothetical protein